MSDEEELRPCPFCGAGETKVVEKKMWSGQTQILISAEVQHWCETIEGQPSRMITRIGRDRASAIKAWNQRMEYVK